MDIKAISDLIELYQLMIASTFGLTEFQRIYAATTLAMKYPKDEHGGREGDKRNEDK